ncbi:hypothetical protein GLOIN_2v1785122 [Rhizophagus irregularis DAOM 181602=DAOM 197198]|uniref:Uncharacterized protein n=1 Tax=Rhizophagus irregularis (strain DAOM 181602 / DAOM 197198 / MUCL 43194) TaxID=747089 RepID=A0A2P4PB13_RHIID|nr:hypothetical protein GLOIN_2v1785122 [Rhizophagus irregularis DAOM 181602=DAOM 197198]POG62586.1 hypothetical protein GLOIN_2v1785122 [Rhizophagus irregularis DAOM 181602=DAOM 197198]|eukprot:XP_025169452.1 hypothetical protein GLOIN_2v1785122 [Rhizophagus irregularis DAOM 181602=DAOM 197198]
MDSISTKQLLTKTRKKLPSLIIDEGACLLLPDEFNGYICADTTADGNYKFCLNIYYSLIKYK